MTTHYGYIGLGNLGGHIAASLLRAGFKVTVHDLNPGLADRLVAAGLPGWTVPKTSHTPLTMC